MATTWVITNMVHDIADGGVTSADWSATAESDDGQYSARRYGKCGFTYDASSPDFVPYADLTQNEVLGWVWSVGGVDKDATESALAAGIDAQENPTEAGGLPWSEDNGE